MKSYVCTYRRIQPKPGDWTRTETASQNDSRLRTFLNTYDQSFYDWGDDPSFFAAKEILGDVHAATWGVCRRDVRSALLPGDAVIFFCGGQNDGEWLYHFIGFGVVKERIDHRADLWRKPDYARFREFYNVLAEPQGKELIRRETFRPFHSDWLHRAKAPYIVFDPTRSAFNLRNPHQVAHWIRGSQVPERWSDDSKSAKIEELIFRERDINRRLRTSGTGYGHAKLNLLRDGKKTRPGRAVAELLEDLRKLV